MRGFPFFLEFNDLEPDRVKVNAFEEKVARNRRSEAMREILTLDFRQFTLASGSNPVHSVPSSVVFESFRPFNRMT